MENEFFAGFIRLHILYHAYEEPIFGLGILRELRRHGYELSPGTLYPLLHRMEERGLLKSEKETCKREDSPTVQDNRVGMGNAG